MKLNFMTDHGSILATTSCASRRASLCPGRAPSGDSSAGGRRSAGLLLTVAVFPVLIALPCLPVRPAFGFLLVGIANGAVILDTRPFDVTEAEGVGAGLGSEKCPVTCGVFAKP